MSDGRDFKFDRWVLVPDLEHEQAEKWRTYLRSSTLFNNSASEDLLR